MRFKFVYRVPNSSNTFWNDILMSRSSTGDAFQSLVAFQCTRSTDINITMINRWNTLKRSTTWPRCFLTNLIETRLMRMRKSLHVKLSAFRRHRSLRLSSLTSSINTTPYYIWIDFVSVLSAESVFNNQFKSLTNVEDVMQQHRMMKWRFIV